MSQRRKHDGNANLAEAFEGARSDYNAARASRFRRRRTGINSMGSGADWHYRSEADYLRVMEQARDMDRNDTIVGQAVTRAVENTVQDGIRLDPRTGDKSVDAELSARWDEWTNDAELCDSSGEQTFADKEHLALRQTLVDGDICACGMDDGTLRMMEAHRLRTPKNTNRNVVHGVLLDEKRRRLQYWFTKDDIDPNRALNRVNDMNMVNVRDKDGNRQLFHVYNPKRCTQTRGMSAFAPIFDDLGMFEDINFATLIQRQVVSCITFFRERMLGYEGTDTATLGETNSTTDGNGNRRTLEGVSPGMWIDGQPGEKLSAFSPQVPSPGYFEQVRLILTLIGVNLGLPLVMVLMDSSETNFSGWRGAVDQAKMGFRRNQRWLVNRFHKPVYLWKVRQWIIESPKLRAKAAVLGEAIFAHRWNHPTWPYIDPFKDASADLLRVRNGLISQRRLHQENGVDWDELSTEICDDNALGIEKAIIKADELSKKYKDKLPGGPIHWQQILSMPTPDGINIALAGPDNSGAQNAGGGTSKNDKPKGEPNGRLIGANGFHHA